jgi:hypothetical protein
VSRLRVPNPNEGKKLKSPSAQPESILPQSPFFCLRHLVNGWNLESCTNDDLVALVKKIHKLCTMNWEQIYKSDRHHFGCEKISRDAIKAGIPGHITPDVQLWAFRFCGLKPMVGYRENRTFRIVWLDSKMKLYDHN